MPRLPGFLIAAAALAGGCAGGDGPGAGPIDAADVDGAAPIDGRAPDAADVDGRGPDGRAPDAAIDGPPASTGPVVVTVQRRRSPMAPLPLAGVTVFASRADGALGDQGVTDAAGQVTLQVEPGGTVTADVPDFGGWRELSSVLGVEPGDALIIDPDRGALGSTVAPGVTYDWPAPSERDTIRGFDHIDVNDGCWHRRVMTYAPDPPLPPLPTFASLGLVAGCGRAPRAVAFAHYDTELLTHVAVLPAVAPTDGSVATVPAWQAPDTTFTSTATGLPAGVTSYAATPAVVIDGHSTRTDSSGVTVTGGGATATSPWSTAFAQARVVHRVSGNVYGAQVCFETLAPGVTSTSFAGSRLIPQVGAIHVDVPTRTVSWSLTPGAPYDGALVRLRYVGPALVTGAEWSLRLASGLTAVTLPELPPALAGRTLVPGLFTYANVGVYDLGTVTTWDQARQLSVSAPEFDAEHGDEFGPSCWSQR